MLDRHWQAKKLCGPGDLAVIRSGEIHSLFSSDKYAMYIFTFDPALFSCFLPESRFPKSFITAEEQISAGLNEEIARQCGYDNVRTFNNAFRRITGQSPSLLRKANI